MTKPNGWFAAHRMDEESSYYRLSLPARSVWWELLGWTDRDTGMVTMSLNHLAKRAGISRELVRKCLVRIQALGMVEKMPPGRYTTQGHHLVHTPDTYKVVNWFKYQVAKSAAVHSLVHTPGTTEQEVASSTKKRAAEKPPPKASPFAPAFWAVLKHYACPPLDKADKGQLLQRLKSGEPLEDLVVKLVTGFAYGARTGRGALGFTRQFNDPITRLEMDDVRSAYRRLAAQEHGPRDGARRRAGDSATQPPAQPGLPEVGAPDQAELGAVHGPGGQAGPVQDHLGLDDGGQPRLGWEAGVLDWIGDAARPDGRDAGLAAGPYPTQEAGGCVEAGGGFDLR